MKASLSIILLVLTTKLAFAQNYFNFPTNNTVWAYLRCDYFDGADNINCSNHYYSLSGDTMINSLIYHKIYEGTTSNQFTSYYAAIRENTYKKVFLLNPGETTENLKFNFAGGVGDTMQINPIRTISSIDSIFISSSYRKRYIISPVDTIIEGIGNINEVIGNYVSFGGVGFHLLCMTMNDTLIYKSKQYKTCDTTFTIPLGINKYEQKASVKIYPNPVNSTIKIFTDEQSMDIKILDVLGNQLLETKQKEIDVSSLYNGVYFLQAGNNTQKIIVQH